MSAMEIEGKVQRWRLTSNGNGVDVSEVTSVGLQSEVGRGSSRDWGGSGGGSGGRSDDLSDGGSEGESSEGGVRRNQRSSRKRRVERWGSEAGGRRTQSEQRSRQLRRQ